MFTWHLSKQVQKYRLSNEIGNLFLAGVWRMALYAGVIRCSAWHKQVPCGEKEDAWCQLDEVIDSFMDHKEMQHTSPNQPPSAQRLLCPAVDPSIIELVTRAPAITQFITLPSYSAASSGHALWPFFLDKQSKAKNVSKEQMVMMRRSPFLGFSIPSKQIIYYHTETHRCLEKCLSLLLLY